MNHIWRRSGIVLAMLLLMVLPGIPGNAQVPLPPIADLPPGIVPDIGGPIALLPPHVVDVHAVRTADDAGNFAATITQREIANVLLARASSHWNGAVVFRLDSVVNINSSKLFWDCVPVAGGCSIDDSADAREAYALAPDRQDKLVVFFRRGGNGAFSCHTCHFVAMPDSISPSSSPVPGHNLLGHEVGHYFWNDHTFLGSRPTTLTAVQDEIRAYVAKGNAKSDGLQVFDADRSRVSDTPPDPGELFWQTMKGSECGVGLGDDTHSFKVDFKDGQPPYSYTFAPDRRNIMSYFQHCLALDPHTASPDQKSVAATSISNWNRGPLVGKDATFLDYKNPPLSTSWRFNWDPGLGSIVPVSTPTWKFMFITRGTRADYILFDEGTFLFDFDVLGGGQVSTSTWDHAWDPSFSTVVPFYVDRAPYLLAYNPTTDFSRIFKVDPWKSGLQPTWSSNSIRQSGTVRRLLGTAWSEIHAFDISGEPFAFRYEPRFGRAEILTLSGGTFAMISQWRGAFAPGFDDSIVVSVNGHPHVLLYEGTTGLTQLVRLDPGGATTVAATVLPAGRRAFAAFDRGAEGRFLTLGRPQPYIPGITSSRNDLDVYRIRNQASGPTIELMQTRSAPSWTRLVSMRLRGLWNVFGYEQATGRMDVKSIIQ